MQFVMLDGPHMRYGLGNPQLNAYLIRELNQYYGSRWFSRAEKGSPTTPAKSRGEFVVEHHEEFRVVA